MSAPLIDLRNYEQVVEQTERLARAFTADRRAAKPNTLETINGLAGHILYEDVLNPGEPAAILIAPDGTEYRSGTRLTFALAQYLAQQPGIDSVTTLGWGPAANQPDMGRALIQMFGRMVSSIIDRLNQVPDKSFLTFLNLIGTRLAPPQPARVPLTFLLAPKAPMDARVPAGTPVAAPPGENESQEISFETERDLNVSRAALISAFVHDPIQDFYLDASEIAVGSSPTSGATFKAFEGTRPIQHTLYIANDAILTAPGSKTVIVSLLTPDAAALSQLLPLIGWAFFDSKVYQPLDVTATEKRGSSQIDVVLKLPDVIAPSVVDDMTAGWLRARLDISLPYGDVIVRQDANGQPLSFIHREGLLPAAALAETNVPAQATIIDLNQPFYPFGDAAISEQSGRYFYLNLKNIYTPLNAVAALAFVLAQTGEIAADAGDNPVHWEYWSASPGSTSGKWTVLNTAPTFQDATAGFTQDGVVRFEMPPSWAEKTLYNVSGYWLRLWTTGYLANHSPQIQSIRAGYDVPLPRLTGVKIAPSGMSWAGRSPELAFANNTALDVSRDFRPFGDHPRRGDVFYLAFEETLAQLNAAVTLNFTVSADYSRTLTPQLVWEYWNTTKNNWQAAAITSDTTNSLTTSSMVRMSTPLATMGAVEVNGQVKHWARARIASGDYGKDAYFVPSASPPYFTLVASTLNPPSLAAVTIDYVVNIPPQEAAYRAVNDFVVSQPAGEGKPFTPFVPSPERRPQLYLGFDRPFANHSITLYCSVAPALYDDTVDVSVLQNPPRVTWEYSADAGWKPLHVQDETSAFRQPGLIVFIGPPDAAEGSRYGQKRYWLRATWERGIYPAAPELRSILTNTTWAVQAQTIRDESLGSSTGDKNLRLRLLKTPVLPGEQLEVREADQPSNAERAALSRAAGEKAIRIVTDTAGQVSEIWVRWQAVVDFYASGPNDRHYRLDRLTGDVTFGDGQHGQIPPPGRGNVRATYRAGGGAAGNRPPGTINQLKAAIPYVVAVTNPEPSQGGAAAETLDAARERGPKQIRHGFRAVTAQDFEDLAYEVTYEVARARAIAVNDRSQAGRVGLIIVPRSADAQPIPSLELINRVEAYLRDRCSPTLDLWVSGPAWSQVSVTVQLVPASLAAEQAAVLAADAALRCFLHPITGGAGGTGWAFGHEPHLSDLYALLEAIPSVDHVESLLIETVRTPPLTEANAAMQERYLVYSGTHTIRLALSGEA